MDFFSILFFQLFFNVELNYEGIMDAGKLHVGKDVGNLRNI